MGLSVGGEEVGIRNDVIGECYKVVENDGRWDLWAVGFGFGFFARTVR